MDHVMGHDPHVSHPFDCLVDTMGCGKNGPVFTVDERFMNEAINLAREGLDQGELPIGAVVVVDDQVVAGAYTQEVTQRRFLVHAELLALDAADRTLGAGRYEARLYTTLEPCLMCLGAAFSACIESVIFGLESPSDGSVAASKVWEQTRSVEGLPNHRLPKLLGGILRSESGALFREYVIRAEQSGGMVDWARDLAELSGH
jgi:tRNA(adenine34) deaminase